MLKNNLVINGGLITVNNVNQFILEKTCQYYAGTPNSDWCKWSSEVREVDWNQQAPAGANYMCCKYNSLDIRCGDNVHDGCRYYYRGSRTLGADDPIIYPN